MRIAVLAAPDSWYFRDLVRAAGNDFSLECLPFSELTSSIDREGRTQLRTASVDLAAFDAVLVRTMPPGSLEQVVFRMDALARLESQGTLVLNPPRAIEAAVDKYLTTAKLAAADLRSPRTIVCQTPDAAMEAFHSLGGDVVLKPLFGSEGRGLTRLNDEALAQRAFKMLAELGAVLYLQEFIQHEGFDVRILLVGQRAWAMKRVNQLDWRTNVSRGASTEPYVPSDELLTMARTASQAVGAPIAGVDLLQARDGSWYVLEVNAVPGWKALARTLNVDVAWEVLEFARREHAR